MTPLEFRPVRRFGPQDETTRIGDPHYRAGWNTETGHCALVT